MAAVSGGVQMTPDPTTIGMPASFAFDPALIMAGMVQTPQYSGSNLGVPAVDQIAGETPSGGGSSAAGYGAAASTRAPHQQPVFWSVVMVAVGAFMLMHAAKINLRG